MRRCDARLLRVRLHALCARHRAHRRCGVCAAAAAPTAFPHTDQQHAPRAAANTDNAARVLSLLAAEGLTPADVDEALRRDPEVLNYDAATEVFPRLAQLRYLRDVSPAGRFAWQVQHESVAQYVTRQPFVLERRFGAALVTVGGQPRQPHHHPPLVPYFAVCKPWDVRHDVPRGWQGVQRFVPKHEGDDTSAEEFVTSQCVQRPPYGWHSVRFAHQIDYATSGVLLACGSQAAAAAAAGCFKRRTAVKTYAALLLGDVAQDTWHVDAPIIADEADPQGFKMRAAATAAEQPGAKAAATSFQVLARGACALEGPWKGAPVALVAVRPLTGRRHQIRVHAALHGVPVLGDCAYSPDRDSFRMFLHAWRLELPGIIVDEGDDDGAGTKTKAKTEKADLTLCAPLPRSFRVAFDGHLPDDVDAWATRAHE